MTLTLTLNLETRVNLMTLLDVQQGNLGTLRLCNKLADKVELTAEERTAVGYTLIPGPNGTSMPAWKTSTTIPDVTVTLENGEREKLRSIVEECPFFRRRDLLWIDPLLATLRE